MRKKFEKLWDFVSKRECPLVQDKEELYAIFRLIQGCESYLEVGSAEGNSLYILSHALKENASIATIDYREEHTKKYRDEINSLVGSYINDVNGNSHNKKIIDEFKNKKFDVVLIDAGHKYADVIADAMIYGNLATKYIIFHDIQMPEVGSAFAWYANQRLEDCSANTFINSHNYGYGILEVKSGRN